MIFLVFQFKTSAVKITVKFNLFCRIITVAIILITAGVSFNMFVGIVVVIFGDPLNVFNVVVNDVKFFDVDRIVVVVVVHLLSNRVGVPFTNGGICVD